MPHLQMTNIVRCSTTADAFPFQQVDISTLKVFYMMLLTSISDVACLKMPGKCFTMTLITLILLTMITDGWKYADKNQLWTVSLHISIRCQTTYLYTCIILYYYYHHLGWYRDDYRQHINQVPSDHHQVSIDRLIWDNLLIVIFCQYDLSFVQSIDTWWFQSRWEH